jgi:adenylate kinase
MNLVILGPQGCGKGTQAELLKDKFTLGYVEMGKVLRNKAKEDSPLGRKINEIINIKKELVPDEVVMEALRETISQFPPQQGIIIDGAPRRVGQIDEVEKSLSETGRKLDKVIYINITETESVIRISKRYSCTKCQAHLILGKDIQNPQDPCHECGGKIEQRSDDTPDGVRKRLKIFRQETMPVIEHYRKSGKLVEIDGTKIVERVFQDIVEKVKK